MPTARTLFRRGWLFSPDGAAGLSLTSRTAVVHTPPAEPQRPSVGIGGAITADSAPDEEPAEDHTKAKAILGVLGASFLVDPMPCGSRPDGLQDSPDQILEVGDVLGGQPCSCLGVPIRDAFQKLNMLGNML